MKFKNFLLNKNLFNRAGIFCLTQTIIAYQKTISPFLKPSCRFQPTCSDYTILAIRENGIFKGLGLALWRIIRCNSLSEPKVDLPLKIKSLKIQ